MDFGGENGVVGRLSWGGLITAWRTECAPSRVSMRPVLVIGVSLSLTWLLAGTLKYANQDRSEPRDVPHKAIVTDVNMTT
jgi:hypothetical protein